MRRLIFKLTVKLIRKYFSEGVSAITGIDGEVIAYKWIWTKELEDKGI